ncbi:MAG TPA: hypothetical protein ENH14_02100 [candidate division WOR-3 bacterium]|uniref:Uncharacterized protein n=1 Tax=candidate division WOR-3 bacterium TaxID=2052148 RepID=A0A7V0LU70_UNCW3|nr:hypothetical protein [candidate division WOR-3 bacterium]
MWWVPWFGWGRGWGRGNPFPFCRFFPWLPRGWRWFMPFVPYYPSSMYPYWSPYYGFTFYPQYYYYPQTPYTTSSIQTKQA